jgi:hypothetical protein
VTSGLLQWSGLRTCVPPNVPKPVAHSPATVDRTRSHAHHDLGGGGRFKYLEDGLGDAGNIHVVFVDDVGNAQAAQFDLSRTR